MTWTQDRAFLAQLHKGPNPDPAAILNARRDLRVSRAELYLTLLSTDPPPTVEQRTALAGMLLSGGEPA